MENQLHLAQLISEGKVVLLNSWNTGTVILQLTLFLSFVSKRHGGSSRMELSHRLGDLHVFRQLHVRIFVVSGVLSRTLDFPWTSIAHILIDLGYWGPSKAPGTLWLFLWRRSQSSAGIGKVIVILNLMSRVRLPCTTLFSIHCLVIFAWTRHYVSWCWISLHQHAPLRTWKVELHPDTWS